DSVDSFIIPVKPDNALGSSPHKAASLPDSVLIQAIRTQDSLYLRLQWEDDSHDVYPNCFQVVNMTVMEPLPLVEFADTPGVTQEEDQVFVLFGGLGESGYDVWNWCALTTGGAGLGLDQSLADRTGTPVRDAIGTAVEQPVLENPGEFKQPTYVHKDTSAFTHYILCATDTLNFMDTLYKKWDSIGGDSVAVQVRNTTGWSIGQRVPGWIIDCNFANRSEAERGSRWEIGAVSVYDESKSQYRVVLARKLNTGDATDDLNLADIESVEVSLGFFDNQWDFEMGGTRRRFSDKFLLILK
ncbi:MAG: hypothetical protein AB1744_14050, partial [Candidatus Zixiibacteriota bacterium]